MEILRQEGDIESISTNLVWSLNGRVRELMLTGKNRVRSKVTDAYIAHLIKIGSMDSLAGLTLIFLLNVEQDNSEGLLECADAITQTLVVLAPFSASCRSRRAALQSICRSNFYACVA